MDKRYSTGTKGRLERHADACKALIHQYSPNFSLAEEFIAQLDPEKDLRVWQQFTTPEALLPELASWLGQETDPPAEKSMPDPAPPPTNPAELSVDQALEQTRAWLVLPETRQTMAELPPGEAVEAALRFFAQKIKSQRS
jgi:hypothetical protein